MLSIMATVLSKQDKASADKGVPLAVYPRHNPYFQF